jgi:hypothetical protein
MLDGLHIRMRRSSSEAESLLQGRCAVRDGSFNCSSGRKRDLAAWQARRKRAARNAA